MPSKTILIFDIESEYGHFRKFNTTTSPLTYPIPPRPALVGLLGAIVGIEREASAGKFNEGVTPVAELFAKPDTELAVQLINPVKKVPMAFNLLDTEKSGASFFNIKQRTQIEFELLKHPCFRVFVACANDALMQPLVDNIQHNQAHFTPYLGLSQFTATFNFVAVTKAHLLASNEAQEVATAINISVHPDIEFEYSRQMKYTSDTLPLELNAQRVVQSYAEVLVEANGKPVKVNSEHIYTTEKYGNLLFL
ncbi:type I-B CRISPR-associated protein Cas5b [Microscilla marina]|uniref:Crispr-associated protein Cas5, hmari subtype n=1 Tax=Microscilla marina ATCC 23134 TaxID=313606 RepID=A1ZHZ1_MICM2|nr:type I-B CRISPR-associated protein Cas5b [Microscilla marina]EAY30148.1 crispr-associated protein Cas5, hmari subtype [Microscilla marina ATCC 23134]